MKRPRRGKPPSQEFASSFPAPVINEGCAVIFAGMPEICDGAEGDMRRLNSFLLNVWREACRPVEIAEAVARGMPILRRVLPLGQVLVRRVDEQRARVETITQVGDGVGRPASRNDCGAGELERLAAWCRQGQVLHATADEA